MVLMINEYVAGFFDAEGYIGVKYSNGYHSLNVTLTNNHKEVLLEIQKIFGGSLTAPRLYGTKLGKEAWVLSFYAITAISFLEAVFPHSIVKKDQIRLALTYPINAAKLSVTVIMKKQRQSIMDQLKEMKQSYKETPNNWESTRKELKDNPIVQKAVKLYIEGMETKKVAKIVDTKVATVSYWLRTLKVNRSREEIAEQSALKQKNRIVIRPNALKAVELFDEGLAIAEIARQLDVKYGTVYNWLKTFKRHRTLEEAQQIRRQQEAKLNLPKSPKPKKIPLAEREDVKRAVELRKNDKLGYEKIAEIISDEFNQICSQSHVGYWFSQLDLMGPTNDDLEEIKEIHRLYVEKEMSLRQVAKEMNKSVTFIQRHIKKAGLTRSLKDAHQLKLETKQEVKLNPNDWKEIDEEVKKSYSKIRQQVEARELTGDADPTVTITPKIDMTTTHKPKLVEWEKGIET